MCCKTNQPANQPVNSCGFCRLRFEKMQLWNEEMICKVNLQIIMTKFNLFSVIDNYDLVSFTLHMNLKKTLTKIKINKTFFFTL